jgi:hypothetical protein
MIKGGVESIKRNREECESWKRAKTFIEHFQMKNGFINLSEVSRQLNDNGYGTRRGVYVLPRE